VVYRFVDDHHASIADVLGDIVDSEAVVIGTETYESSLFPYTEFVLNEMVRKVEYEKPLLLIAVFGWAAAAGKKVRSTIENSRFDLVDAVEFKGLLTPESEADIRRGVEALALALHP
jgi:flavorubredoxin